MRRFLRIRLFLVLSALILAPAAVLPFAERLRTEWARFWEPEPEVELPLFFAGNPDYYDSFVVLDMPPGEWCGTVSAPEESDPIVIERLTTEPDPFADRIGIDDAVSALNVPFPAVEP